MSIGIQERFEAKFIRCSDSECWNWTAYKCHGYGRMGFNGKIHMAHRMAFKIAYGPFDERLKVLHRCDNPSCVNPSHLFVGTQKDNVDDMTRKGRRASFGGERNSGRKLSADQVMRIRQDKRSGPVIAAEYGVTRAAINKIRRGVTWVGAIDELKAN